jgi:hypothetical protein
VHALRSALLAAALLVMPSCGRADSLHDAIAKELRHWTEFLASNPDSSNSWKQVKGFSEPVLARTKSALDANLDMLALQRLATVRTYLAASEYVSHLPEHTKLDSLGLIAESAQTARQLADAMVPGKPDEFAGMHPAALRALAEAARPQVRIYHETALDIVTAVEPEFGFYYLGQAVAQHQFLAVARSLSTRSGPGVPGLRSIAPELDSLETQLLAAYRGAVSIDRHSEFIAASSTLKEARELDGLGLRYGAMLRYLQARQRVAPLRPTPPSLGAAELRARLDAFAKRIRVTDADHSIARIFLESAEADIASVPADSAPPNAVIMVADLLPNYFAALGPAPPPAPAVTPLATVTLVRWPYT